LFAVIWQRFMHKFSTLFCGRAMIKYAAEKLPFEFTGKLNKVTGGIKVILDNERIKSR